MGAGDTALQIDEGPVVRCPEGVVQNEGAHAAGDVAVALGGTHPGERAVQQHGGGREFAAAELLDLGGGFTFDTVQVLRRLDDSRDDVAVAAECRQDQLFGQWHRVGQGAGPAGGAGRQRGDEPVDFGGEPAREFVPAGALAQLQRQKPLAGPTAQVPGEPGVACDFLHAVQDGFDGARAGVDDPGLVLVGLGE